MQNEKPENCPKYLAISDKSMVMLLRFDNIFLRQWQLVGDWNGRFTKAKI